MAGLSALQLFSIKQLSPIFFHSYLQESLLVMLHSVDNQPWPDASDTAATFVIQVDVAE